MGKRSKSGSTASELGIVVESKRAKNKKNKPDCDDTNNEPKPEDTIITPEDKQVKRKNKSQPTESGKEKKNKKIIFKDDDNEPVEIENSPIQRKRTNQGESTQENEEDIKDEDIDKFCDELNDEDNEQYENWVKLIEAKLHYKNKPK